MAGLGSRSAKIFFQLSSYTSHIHYIIFIILPLECDWYRQKIPLQPKWKPFAWVKKVNCPPLWGYAASNSYSSLNLLKITRTNTWIFPLSFFVFIYHFFCSLYYMFIAAGFWVPSPMTFVSGTIFPTLLYISRFTIIVLFYNIVIKSIESWI